MNIVEIRDQEAVVSHRKIAEFTGVQQKNIVELIATHHKDFEEFGSFSVSNGETSEVGGRPEKTYYLNEQQATLLMTYLRNTPVVRMFKKALVREFFELRRESCSGKYTHPRLPSHATVKTLIAELGRSVAIVFIARHMGIGKEETMELAAYCDRVTQEAVALPRQIQATQVDYDVEEFCISRIKTGNFGFLEVSKIYEEYKTFCIQFDVKPKSIVNFGKQFRGYIGLEAKVVKIRGVATRGYEGIAIAQLTIDAIES